ncbi:helix-turn-helix domain-containing protein [Actinoplanes lobatus]|nr:helix-turn-helix transcriptional regulator [Actinoplanes lobatus]MBB4755345.1 transcriptional regulator with XRE-family HTH domain [Actinoplanes lobatus]
MSEHAERKRRRRPLPMDPSLIARRRRALGMTITQTAAKARITKGYLSQIESGQRGGSPSVVLQIAAALECSPDDLAPAGDKAAA